MGFRDIGIYEANWIQLAQNRVRWRAFWSTVINIRFPQRKQSVWESQSLSAFQRLSCKIE